MHTSQRILRLPEARRSEKTKGRILLVDDEPNALGILSAVLRGQGYEVISSTEAEYATGIIETGDVDVVITDLRMQGRDGMCLFEYICKVRPDIPVVFLTAYGTNVSAAAAMNRGAFYYFVKPPDYEKLRSIVARAVEQHRLKKEIDFLKSRLRSSRDHTPKTLKELEIQAIRDMLKRCNGNKSKTAKMLGISRKAFYKRLREACQEDAG